MRLEPIAIVIPARNEEARIGTVLRNLPPAAAGHVLVVDDGSSDETARIARESGVEVLCHPVLRGYGAALQSGIAEARRMGASAVATLHADGQYPPEELPRLLEALSAGADVASGVRLHGRGYPIHRVAGERVLDWLLSRAAGRRLHSFSSGFRAYGPRALKEIPWEGLPDSYGFDAAALLLAARLRLRIAEIPVAHAAGPSGLKAWRYAVSVLRWAARMERVQPGDLSPGPSPETFRDTSSLARSPPATSPGPGPPGGGPS